MFYANKKNSNVFFVLIGVGVLFALFLIGVIGYNLSKSHSKTADTLGKTGKIGEIERNSIGMEFAYIPPGEFMMGSTNGDDDEEPVHKVIISKGFWMGRTEVTQAQWKAIMGTELLKCSSDLLMQSITRREEEVKGEFLGANKPVICLNDYDASRFIEKLNAQNDGYKYRLPTEAEWEYAARAGTIGDYAGDLDSMAWYGKNSGGRTHEVGTKQPNAWGLYDMHGNVSERVEDWFVKYQSATVTDPKGYVWRGEIENKLKVVRGGGFRGDAKQLRTAKRDAAVASGAQYITFRVVRQ